MRFPSKNRIKASGFAILLAVGAPILLALPGLAQAKAAAHPANPVTLTGGEVIEIAGPGWKMRYGSAARAWAELVQPKVVMAGSDRAWFSHGGWLRLIDVPKGVVIGRWHFTDVITNLEPKADGVEVEYKLASGNDNSIITKRMITPTTPGLEFGFPYSLLYARVSQSEAERPQLFNFLGVPPKGEKLKERVAKLLPEFEEMARRDPTAPFIQAAYGGLLKEAGDARAKAVLQAATEVELTDYTELWTLSSYLDYIGEEDLARAAFERGYRDFLERGNDPRLFYGLIGRLVVYRTSSVNPKNAPNRKELIERIYRVAPNIEASQWAWIAYARELEAKGDPAASIWHERAKQSAEADFLTWSFPRLDWALLGFLGGLFGGVVFLPVQWFRYRAQRRLDAAKGVITTYWDKRTRSLSYWTRRERYMMATMVAISWFSLGVMAVVLSGFLRVASMPINGLSGSLASPLTLRHLEKFPETNGRNFLIALCRQQSGEADTALQLYLSQPRSAQAWNNAGVIYREKGEAAKAKEAFEKALQIDPGLNEAKLNLGQPTTDLWTTQFRNSMPQKAMIAPPTAKQMLEAFMGTSEGGIYLRALAWPLMGLRLGILTSLFGESVGVPTPILWVGIFLLALTFLVLFMVPYREVAEAPPGWLRWLELILPGSSRTWGWLGGIALASWGSLWVALFLLANARTAMIFTTIATPNVSRAFYVTLSSTELATMQIGNATYLWLVPATFFVINLWFFVRDRKAGVR